MLSFAPFRPLASGSLLLLVVVAAGCKPSTPASTGDAGIARDASVASAASASTAASVEAEARTLVESWVSAQNAAAFSKYEELYAPRFEGIRRSGEQVAKLDRARWMKERARMFKQKTTVSVKEITISPSHDGAEVRFVQTWSSDSYRDEGPKRMVLVRESSKLKIAREEMLASKTIAPGATLPEDKLAFVIAAPTTELVIARDAKDEWAIGAPKVVAKQPMTTRRDATGLPAELSAWKGKKVELFGNAGVSCQGTVSGLSVVGRVVPHFGTVNRWNGTGDSAGEPKPAPEIVAQEAWDLSGRESGSQESGRLVVADVKTDSGDCTGAIWGRVIAAGASKTPMASAKPASAETKALMLTELRKTKAYTETQARYVSEKEPKDPPKWEDFDPNVTALTFEHETLGTVVSISIHAGAGCGSFGGSISAVWEKKGSTLRPLRDASTDEIAPLSAGDVDGDGKIDLLEREGILRSKGDKLEAPAKITVPDFDCGC